MWHFGGLSKKTALHHTERKKTIVGLMGLMWKQMEKYREDINVVTQHNFLFRGFIYIFLARNALLKSFSICVAISGEV